MDLFGLVPIAIGIGLILGAKKIAAWNLSSLNDELSSVEEKANAGQWNSTFAAFEARMMKWQIHGWQGVAGTPVLIAIGVGFLCFGIAYYISVL